MKRLRFVSVQSNDFDLEIKTTRETFLLSILKIYRHFFSTDLYHKQKYFTACQILTTQL